MRGTLLLTFLTIFLVACSSTNVVKLDGTSDSTTDSPSDSESTDSETPSTEPTGEGASVETASGKTVVACDDTDLNDPSSVGAVTVDYSDGTTEMFYDTCVANSFVLTEYTCDGKAIKSQNAICKTDCINVKVKDQTACPGCKVGFCA